MSLLLAIGCPAAIIRLVITIHVDAIQGFAIGTLAHIGQEILEGRPPVADGDTSAAIARIGRDAGIPAPGMHVLPGKVSGCASAIRWRRVPMEGYPDMPHSFDSLSVLAMVVAGSG
jgi:hypothetical protein